MESFRKWDLTDAAFLSKTDPAWTICLVDLPLAALLFATSTKEPNDQHAEHLPSLVAEAYEQTEQEYMVFFVVNFNYFTISSHNHKSINIDKIYFTIALLT